MQMGRLFCYFIFTGCLSLIWARQIPPNSLPLKAVEKEKKNNVTDSTIQKIFPIERMDNGKTKEEVSPFRFQERRRNQAFKHKNEGFKQAGLSAYEEHLPRNIKRNLSPPLPPPYLRRGYNIYRYAESAKKYLVPPHSQQLFPAKNYINRKPSHNSFAANNISTRDKNPRPPPFFNKKNNSTADSQSQTGEASEIIKIFHGYPNEGRSPRFHSRRHNSKICNSCNSVPWIPLIKVPYSYRQERNQNFNVHKPHLNFDLNPSSTDTSSHGFLNNIPSTSSNDFLLPPVPALPSSQLILDGTISSSFGLPVGNIPISHGMLAPLNHLATKFNRYGANSIDYSNSLSYFNPQNILNNNNAFPELSPVPIVPIYDSGQFNGGSFFNTPVTKLLPPTTKTLAVSNVILTFSEGNSNGGFGSDTVDLHPPPPDHLQQHLNSPTSIPNPVENAHSNFEIIKSVPIAEFLSSNDFASPPPAQHPSQNFHSTSYSQDSISQNLNYQSAESSEQSNESTEDNPSNYLVPPPIDYFYNSTLNEVFPPYPPKNEENTFQGQLHASPSESNIIASGPTPSWIFTDEQANLNPTAHPLLAESQAIASVVNSQLYPELTKPFQITSPATQNADGSKSKKIQIIIPYTTKTKNEADHNAVESIRYEVLQSPSDKLPHTTNITDDITFTTSIPLTSEIYSSKNWSSTQQQTFANTVEPLNYRTIKAQDGNDGGNANQTYYSETQHIIASNVRQLLLNEVEKSPSDQNFPLQRNIDNWTALEYSNHKVYENKEPQKLITQALAVTTIPGTSISHLLLPSKKIPNEYFATTALPEYEETPNFLYEVVNSTVNSSPFTARPYATTNFYSPLTSITKEATKDFHRPSNEGESLTTLNYNDNYQKNYTIVGKSRVSTWSRLNENLPVSSAKTRKIEDTTLSVFTNKFPTKTEKVEVVTPVYWTNAKNFTEFPFRRTTRHLTTTARSTTVTENQKTKNQRPKIFPFKSRLRTTLLKTVNSTKLEKVSKGSAYNETSSKNITKWDDKTEGAKRESSENLNKTILTVQESSWSSFNVSPTLAPILLRNISSEEVIKLLKTNKSEEFSINDIFPFRNQELPWESNSLNASNLSYQNERQRKSLIKQTVAGKSKTTT